MFDHLIYQRVAKRLKKIFCNDNFKCAKNSKIIN